MGSQVGWGTSKEFLDVVKAIGEAKSKAEEERIVTAEIETLKKKIACPDVPRKKMKEYIIRLVYVEMLGHAASFGYIHAVKMTHDDNLLLKKSGYLAVTLFLNEDHDLIILIVNTIQKDLRSDNYLVACAALTAVCKLINEETIPAVLPQVVDLLSHPKELVKKKAVMALHRFYQRAPNSVSHLLPRIQKAVDDTDPSVCSAALCALYDVIITDPRPYKAMTFKFVNILKTVVEHRLPKSYDYHRTPAPFIQIKVLKILAKLGDGDKSTSELMYSVLGDVLKKADVASNIGNAILYECIRTITSIHPHTKLIGDVAEITSRFLKHDNHNLKYMGIDSLGRIIKINPDFVEEHQLAVIDCLEDPDDTLKRKTLDLLYKMTRSTNVEVIVKCMISYMRTTINDSHSKTEIASRIVELAERFAPSNQWFIQTMNQVFELAGDLVPAKVAHDLMRLIAEGAGEEDEDADSQLRSSAVESYLQLLAEPKLPSILLQVICWVLGEYSTADGSQSAIDIIGKLCDVIEAHPGDDVVKGYAITAITKICAFEISVGRKVHLYPGCRAVIDELAASHSTDLQQRTYELQAFLALSADVIGSVLPIDASCEDIEVDRSLTFLLGVVETALANGARPYISDHERDAGGIGSLVSNHVENGSHPASLKFEAYEKPVMRVLPSAISNQLTPSIIAEFEVVQSHVKSVKPSASHSISVAPEIDLINPESTRLRLDGVQRKWGRQTLSPYPSSTSTFDKEMSRSRSSSSDRGGFYKGDGAITSEIESSIAQKQQREISFAKTKLAASLFGGSPGSTNDRISNSIGGGGRLVRNVPRGHTSRGGDKDPSLAIDKNDDKSPGVSNDKVLPPPPDLLDFTDDSPTVVVPASDPFKLLEGLLDPQKTSDPAISTSGYRNAGNDATGVSLSGLEDVSGLPGFMDLAGLSHWHRQSAVAARSQGLDGSPKTDSTAHEAGVMHPASKLFKDLLG
ncbi:unnamed protein product [Calypogeia fissa]